jgi:hypothetical protein
MMFAYSQAACPQLLLGSNLAGDVGYTVALLPQSLSGTGQTFTLQDVLTRYARGTAVGAGRM